MAPDEKAAGGSSPSEENKEENDESLKTSEADTETSEGEESIKAVPYTRFKQINDAKKQAETIANWYRQNIGNPDDVMEFRKWKSSQVKEAEKQEADGEISPAKLAQIRALMRKADPEYAEMVERQKKSESDRIDAQYDTAEDMVRDLAAEQLGLKAKADESDIAWVAQQTMLAIQNDEKLLRMWNAGNMNCIKKGFQIVQDRHDKLGKSISKMRQVAQDKRKVSKLPTLPSASGSISSQSSNNGDNKREKGITKATHEDAWAVLQQTMND